MKTKVQKAVDAWLKKSDLLYKELDRIKKRFGKKRTEKYLISQICSHHKKEDK